MEIRFVSVDLLMAKVTNFLQKTGVKPCELKKNRRFIIFFINFAH